jgi:hypothetical protein
MSIKRPSDQEIKDFFDQHPDVQMSVIAQRLSMTVKQLKNILMDRK